MAIVLISPALAPVIGGLLTELVGWRSIMLGLCGVALIAAFVVMKRIPAGAGIERPAAPISLRCAYSRILRNRLFMAATAAMAFSSASLYLFLGAAPFLLEVGYQLTPRETGFCLLLVACASLAGTRLVGRVQRWTDPLRLGTSLGLLAALVLGALSLSGAPSLPLLLAPIVVLGLTAGLIGPTAIAQILSSEPGLEGTATSLAGALQLSASALFAWLLGPIAAESALNLGLALLPLTGAATAAALLARRAGRDR
jgi:MFS transporter, DHA1 family, multidrug resistance protein